MEVLMVIMLVIIYFLLDKNEKEPESKPYDFIKQK